MSKYKSPTSSDVVGADDAILYTLAKLFTSLIFAAAILTLAIFGPTAFTLAIDPPTKSTLVIAFATTSISDVDSFKSLAAVTTFDISAATVEISELLKPARVDISDDIAPKLVICEFKPASVVILLEFPATLVISLAIAPRVCISVDNPDITAKPED